MIEKFWNSWFLDIIFFNARSVYEIKSEIKWKTKFNIKIWANIGEITDFINFLKKNNKLLLVWNSLIWYESNIKISNIKIVFKDELIDFNKIDKSITKKYKNKILK